MSTPDPTAMVIRRPADLLGAVPYLVGFHPTDSAVIVGLDEYRIAFTARIDLPGPGDDLDEYREYVARVVGITARHATRAMLVGYGPAETVTPVIDLARHHLARHRIPVLEALRLTDGRYWSYTCTNPACCPPGGAVYEPATAAAAHAVAAGLVALPSRDHLVASLAPQPDRQADLRRALPHAAAILSADLNRVHAAGGAAAMHAWLDRRGRQALRDIAGRHRDGATISDEQAATLLILLRHTPIRDQALQAATEPADQPLWTDLTRRAPHELVPAPATMAAYTALRQGHGAVANVALDRALHADPDYTMAQLLRAAISSGLPPALLHARLTQAPTTRLLTGTEDPHLRHRHSSHE